MKLYWHTLGSVAELTTVILNNPPFMKAYEIFQEVAPATAASIFQYLRDEQREVYTVSLSTLAANRKLRPVFVQRKPVPAQIEWLVKNVKLKASDEIAEHVIQLWLMKAHQTVLVEFLDGVGIEHDGEGAAEDIPEKINAKKLKSTVEKLLKDHDPEVIRVYLHVFQKQRAEGWPEITSLIEATPALQFGEPEEPPAKETPAETEKPAPAKETAQEDEAGEEE
ncbi:MAG: hypothetical protein P1U68_00680 [Verrucomicrobiales bacterium]|nr:hypothetical protein [Verrucomicrobiales bacterium]